MAEKWVVLEHPEIEDSRQVTTASAAAMKAKKGWVVVAEVDAAAEETVVTRSEAFAEAYADNEITDEDVEAVYDSE